MKVSYSWLKEFVKFEVTPRQLASDLTNLGVVVETVSAFGQDSILDLDLTTNRPDCLSHLGVAREIATRYQLFLELPLTSLRESSARTDSDITVRIESPKLCSRYCARVIRGVKVAPSPDWIVQRLESLGIRSINNIVDATNYVLLELGHPLHAFDLARIHGKAIIIREANAGEKLFTIDGIERELRAGMLVIADQNSALALAGVMGGLESEIDSLTRDILLESAWFEPISVRTTSKSLMLHTEASHRFERGADIDSTIPSIDRAAALIQQLAGGEILNGVIDAHRTPVQRSEILLRGSRITQVMGAEIEASFVERVLSALNFKIIATGKQTWRVQPPASRLDVAKEIDLIEEIARHYGYDQFPSTLPLWKGASERRTEKIFERALKQSLVSLGYSETITYSFVDAAENGRFSSLEPVLLKNPLSTETEVMRTSLVPGLLASFVRNYNHGIKSIRLYELGRLYSSKAASAPREDNFLGIIASGNIQEKTVHSESRSCSFFDLKGDIEILLESLGLPVEKLGCQAKGQNTKIPNYYHPTVSAELRMGEYCLGILGQMHPKVCEQYKIRQPVFLAEIPIETWIRLHTMEKIYAEFPRFPAVHRDLSIIVDEDLDYEAIESTVLQAKIKEVRRLFPFDLYTGENLPSHRKSISFSIVYQAMDRTLVDEEINRYHEQILALLQKQMGAQLRT